MAHTCTQKGDIFTVKKKGKTCTYKTQKLFMLNSEASMCDQHEMTRDSCCTNRYLEKVVHDPEIKKDLSLVSEEIFNSLLLDEFQLQLKVRIVRRGLQLTDSAFDWMQQYCFPLLMHLPLHIDKVLPLMFDRSFSSLHYKETKQERSPFAIVFLVFDTLLFDFETRPIFVSSERKI